MRDSGIHSRYQILRPDYGYHKMWGLANSVKALTNLDTPSDFAKTSRLGESV